VQADLECLTMVFDYLIRNAQDAAKKSGLITIEAGLINGVTNASVSDTGEGMSPDFIHE